MKHRVLQLMVVVVVAAASLLVAGTTRADYTFGGVYGIRDVSDFYESLAPFGYWVETDRYGWCWYPAYVDSDWRPYANGYWMWSDQGWYWVSDEPWAWACYHYGRWVWDSYYGWLWVPDVEWAPAWVAWREGGGYVGWAPLTPECQFIPYTTTVFVQQTVYVPQFFVFVLERQFCDRIKPAIFCKNPLVFHRTANAPNIRRVDQAVINDGPSVERIERVNPGRVVTVNPQRPLPAKLVEHRRAQENPAAPRSAPEVVRGTPRQADVVVAQPTSTVPSQERVLPARIEQPRPAAPGRGNRPVHSLQFHPGTKPPTEIVAANPPPPPVYETKQSPRPAKENTRRAAAPQPQPQAQPLVADAQPVAQSAPPPSPQASPVNGMKVGHLRGYGRSVAQVN